MLGVIRFSLAFCVIAFHLVGTIQNLGQLAVNFFYVISGFLITLVLNETYKFSLLPFATNRFLRLYPAYYAVAAAGLLFTLCFAEHSKFHISWTSTATNTDVAANLLMFPWAFLADKVVAVNFLQLDILQSSVPHHRLVPSTWSVGVEIACYFMLWLFTARRFWTSAFTVAAAAIWQWHVVSEGLPLELNYFPVPAAMLPFGAGSMAYHLARKFQLRPLSRNAALWTTIVTGFLFVAIWRQSLLSTNFIGSPNYYLNTALAFLAMLLINRTRHQGLAGSIDKWLGDLAYPVFLGQYVFGFIAWEILGTDAPSRGWSVFALGSIITLVASIVIVKLVDHRLIASRNRVRERSPSGSGASACRA
jgi:peptidoglycan/LPS O-acetylase OafA/YrhL